VRAKESVDDTERIELYRQAMQHILEAAPFIWGFGVQQIYATRSDIQWTPRSDSRIFMDEASWK
jgi:ABC-type transport system substrate-binding protein